MVVVVVVVVMAVVLLLLVLVVALLLTLLQVEVTINNFKEGFGYDIQTGGSSGHRKVPTDPVAAAVPLRCRCGAAAVLLLTPPLQCMEMLLEAGANPAVQDSYMMPNTARRYIRIPPPLCVVDS